MTKKAQNPLDTILERRLSYSGYGKKLHWPPHHPKIPHEPLLEKIGHLLHRLPYRPELNALGKALLSLYKVSGSSSTHQGRKTVLKQVAHFISPADWPSEAERAITAAILFLAAHEAELAEAWVTFAEERLEKGA